MKDHAHEIEQRPHRTRPRPSCTELGALKPRPHRPVALAYALLSAALALALAACQGAPASLPPGTTPPTHSPELVAITATPQEFAFTLTIIHSGQVYGEIEPCG